MRIDLPILLLVYGCLVSSGCNHVRDPEKLPPGVKEDVFKRNYKNLEGEELSKIYCSACHLYTPPSMLNKKIWREGVLPQMAARIGIKEGNFNPFRGMNPEDMKEVIKAGIYPSKPLIEKKQWDLIKQYYLETAPDSLYPVKREPQFISELKQFRARGISLLDRPAVISYLGFDHSKKNILAGDAMNFFNTINPDGKIVNTIRMESPVTDVEVIMDGYILTLIGIIYPNDQMKGKLVHLKRDGAIEEILTGLQRPVLTKIYDINKDGFNDYVVAQFGNHTGKLSWYEVFADRLYKEHNLSNLPGAIRVEIRDFNQDGKEDIVALMAQGDESLHVYINKGDGTFEMVRLLRFNPVFGSVYFEFADFNKDGLDDILYVGGDNADYSMILKPYHGIRIYLNKGSNQFEEEYFYHLNGAFKALPFDFDQDGDLDIAAISYFPDFNSQPYEGFIYLENISSGNFRFAPYTFKESEEGRWLVMEKADIDGDMDMDLMLGSFTYAVTPVNEEFSSKWNKNKISIMILENNIFP